MRTLITGATFSAMISY
jgi:hypothetical protein